MLPPVVSGSPFEVLPSSVQPMTREPSYKTEDNEPSKRLTLE